MKMLFAVLALLVSTVTLAESGFYYNPERDGEGVMVTIDDYDRVAFALFTYWERGDEPPVVSPPRPDPTLPVSPCNNCPIWYIGTGDYRDGGAVGDFYAYTGIDYPSAVDGVVGEPTLAGVFLLEENGSGFNVSIDCERVIPHDAYICNNTFTFTAKLIGE